MKTESHEENITVENIPVVEITDPYGYITANKVIVNFLIKSPRGVQKRKLVRTKNEGYLMN